ncbi:MAG: heat-inducible transcriptional repressor HrcA [Acidobacteriota bacterium]
MARKRLDPKPAPRETPTDAAGTRGSGGGLRGTRAESRLGDRDREILKDIIHTYALTGDPVSSRLLSKHTQHSLSAASIRNTMADLEDLGLLRQPHTSAGRVPTESAYRMYVQTLMTTERLPARERRYIHDQMDVASDADRVLAVASHLLSELSSQIGVVLKPAVEEIVLRSADFVPLGGQRVLCVVVSQNGFVDNVVVETESVIPRRDLVRFSNYVTDHFAGQTVREIRDHLLTIMAEEKSHLDEWLRSAIAFAQQALTGSTAPRDVLVEGTTSLLGQPELSDLETVRRMLDTFADKARLTNVLSLCLESGDGVRVYLGEDSEVTQELDFSLVATPYTADGQPIGTLGVIGPSRMEYPRVVPLVRYLSDTLSQALARDQDQVSTEHS